MEDGHQARPRATEALRLVLLGQRYGDAVIPSCRECADHPTHPLLCTLGSFCWKPVSQSWWVLTKSQWASTQLPPLRHMQWGATSMLALTLCSDSAARGLGSNELVLVLCQAPRFLHCGPGYGSGGPKEIFREYSELSWRLVPAPQETQVHPWEEPPRACTQSLTSLGLPSLQDCGSRVGAAFHPQPPSSCPSPAQWLWTGCQASCSSAGTQAALACARPYPDPSSTRHSRVTLPGSDGSSRPVPASLSMQADPGPVASQNCWSLWPSSSPLVVT